jgi:uncharacterized protein (UPF0248 family)
VVQEALARGRRGRRGRVYEELSRIVHGGGGGVASVVIEERGWAGGVREVPVERIRLLKQGFMVLDDGTLVPLHRVLGVRLRDGRVQWLRRGGGEGEPGGGGGW